MDGQTLDTETQELSFFWTEGVFFLIVLNEEEILHNSTD